LSLGGPVLTLQALVEPRLPDKSRGKQQLGLRAHFRASSFRSVARGWGTALYRLCSNKRWKGCF
jgi:hypothetical protein